ncbi:Calx-beta domain-containing protein, partial [Microcoleus sp. N3A4]|uniref:Calx-beta domain-containing protein n=1 Tax=Microcoleus sp. N3A4 TaxID=3055379 RepID=UPI002FD6C2E1
TTPTPTTPTPTTPTPTTPTPTTPTPTDLAGNTLSTARDIGTFNGTQTFNDFVGSADIDDFHSLNVTVPSELTITLTDLSADADLLFVEDTNGNGVVDNSDGFNSFEILGFSGELGTTSEKIQGISEPGKYFIWVKSYEGNTNYNLAVTQTPSVSTPTPTPPTPTPPTPTSPTPTPTSPTPTPPTPVTPPAGSLQFSAATYTVNEDGTPVTAVTVTRTGSSDGAVGAVVSLSNGTAKFGSGDYSTTPTTVNFAAGDTAPKTIQVPILDDTAYDPNETLTMTLKNPTGGGTLGTQSNATLAIVDNDTQPEWLSTLNFHRTAADLPPVRENPTWREGAVAHSRYGVKNNELTHYEEPGNQFYTPEGLKAGMNGNVSSGKTDVGAIERLISIPFHALGMLDPRLTEVGFGAYREADGGIEAAATLPLEYGSLPSSVQFPIMWPGNGQTIPASIRSFLAEYPDALTGTGNPPYTSPAGLPLLLQLGSGNVTPNVTAHSFSRGGTQLAHAVFDETNYVNPNNGTAQIYGPKSQAKNDQEVGRGILDSRDAVVLIPRDPLLPGETYTASITANGKTYTWSFTVGPQAAIVGTAGNDTLNGEELGDTISGLAGNDLLQGGNGNDSLDGGDGNDDLFGQVGNDTLLGSAGNDTLQGQEGNDSLNGGDGNDNLFGQIGDDFLNGGGGNDALLGEAGRDTFIFDGASGLDTINSFVVADDKIQVSASFGLSVNQILTQANQFATFSEITLSSGNEITIFHDVSLTAANFTII